MRFPAAVVAVSVVALASLGIAWPATAADTAAPSSQDTTFMQGNEQVNLAEQTIGAIAQQRSQNPDTLDLAGKTISDHKLAQSKLAPVAQADSVTLPTAPNAQQQSQAAQLKSVSADQFDLTYAQIQVAGHEQSIAATEQEIASGSDSAVISYAKVYLPLAQMHLTMAQSEVRALGGTPTGVPAGSGGLVASQPANHNLSYALILAGCVVLLSTGFVLLRRQRQHG